MTRPSIRFWTCVFLAFVTVGLGGCSRSQPARFYLLHSTTGSEIGPDTLSPTSEICVGVGPVELPDYLDRPQIVTRTAPGKLELAEFDRWAEPLSENFARVLAAELSAILSTSRVIMYPWPRTSQVDYQVAVDVMQFEGVPGGLATLGARWTLRGDQGRKVLVQRSSEISEPVGPGNYEALVAAQSRAVTSLARDIATAVCDAVTLKPGGLP